MYVFTALFSLPMLAACVAGLALVRARAGSLPPRTARLATLGLAALLASTVVAAAWQVALPVLFQENRSIYSLVATVEWLVTAGLSVAGLSLLVAAVLSRSAPAHPWAAEPYPPPQPPVTR